MNNCQWHWIWGVKMKIALNFQVNINNDAWHVTNDICNDKLWLLFCVSGLLGARGLEPLVESMLYIMWFSDTSLEHFLCCIPPGYISQHKQLIHFFLVSHSFLSLLWVISSHTDSTVKCSFDILEGSSTFSRLATTMETSIRDVREPSVIEPFSMLANFCRWYCWDVSYWFENITLYPRWLSATSRVSVLE